MLAPGLCEHELVVFMPHRSPRVTTEPLPICRRNEAAVEDRSRAATQATDGDPEGPTTGRLRGWPPDLGLAACVVIAAIAWALEAVVRGLGIAAISAVVPRGFELSTDAPSRRATSAPPSSSSRRRRAPSTTG